MWKSSTRRTASWVAMLALFASTLAPVVSHLLSATLGGARNMVEICSSRGLERLVLSASASDFERRPQAPGESVACPFCLPSAGAAALPTQRTGTLAAHLALETYSFVFRPDQGAPANIPEDSRPRGPPAFA